MAHPRRGDRAFSWHRAPSPGRAHRPTLRGLPPVGLLAGRARRRVQLHVRDHSLLLHGHPRAGAGRARGWRHGRAVASPGDGPPRRHRPRAGPCCDRPDGVRDPRTDAGLCPGSRLRDSRALGRRRPRHLDPGGPREHPGCENRARHCGGGRPRRPARLRRRHHGDRVRRWRSERRPAVGRFVRGTRRQSRGRPRRGSSDRPGARRLPRHEPGFGPLDRRRVGLPGRGGHPARRRAAGPHDGRLHRQRSRADPG